MKQLAGMGAALALALSGCEKKAEPLPSTPHEKSLTPVEQRDPVLPRAPAVYVVKKGDTLSRIAKELGVSARELVKANDLTDGNRIREGQMYHPGKFPGGVLICYDPDPKCKSSGSGGRSWGHIEWCTVDQKGNRWFVHAVNSEVSGGSPFCRQQFNRDMLHPELPPNCRVYVLTTPECKREWVARQEVASSYRQAQR